jgi:hypothetical protein
MHVHLVVSAPRAMISLGRHIGAALLAVPGATVTLNGFVQARVHAPPASVSLPVYGVSSHTLVVSIARSVVGVGKTVLARGLVQGLVNDTNLEVTSPSFMIDNTYPLPADSPSAAGDVVYVHHQSPCVVARSSDWLIGHFALVFSPQQAPL